MTYLRVFLAALLAIAMAAQDVYFYNRGKNSGFSSVLAGVATVQKKDELAVTASVAQSSEDATKIANLERDKNDLYKKLKAKAAASPQPDCRVDADSLSALKAISDSTKP